MSRRPSDPVPRSTASAAVTASAVLALMALIVGSPDLGGARVTVRATSAEVVAVLGELPAARAMAAVVGLARDLLATPTGRDLLASTAVPVVATWDEDGPAMGGVVPREQPDLPAPLDFDLMRLDLPPPSVLRG